MLDFNLCLSLESVSQAAYRSRQPPSRLKVGESEDLPLPEIWQVSTMSLLQDVPRSEGERKLGFAARL